MLGLFVQKHAQAVQLLHDVTVIYVTADSRLSPGETQVDITTFEGIKEIRIYFGKRTSKLFNSLSYVNAYFKGISKAFALTGKPDLVHVHILSRTAIPALWLKYTRGIPFVVTEHWSRYLPVNRAKGAFKGWFRKTFTKFAVSEACAVTTVTRNLAEAMEECGLKNKYIVIPNVADTQLFRVNENKNNGKVKRLVHVTCFDEPAKNLKGIINVIQSLATDRDDFVLDVVGDGVDFKVVKAFADKTGLVGSRIHFYGLLTGEELAGKIRTADVMVMFSNYENLPCTIVESLCCGVPVISSNVGGISEHISQDFGELVSAGNEKQLEKAISNFLDLPDRYNPSLITQYGNHHFSLESVARQFNNVYSICYDK
jgi:glycosyltransferase involved in cell wall biosynthesis